MICTDTSQAHPILVDNLVVPISYAQPTFRPMVIQNLSTVAQVALVDVRTHVTGRYISPDQPEVLALRILDFLSSKQGYIRRKGPTFRTPRFYKSMLPQLLDVIRAGRPLVLSAICLSPNFTNAQLSGESPYPHMASYIAFENLHKIAAGVRSIYAPGVEFVLGYEGYLVRSLYFHSDAVLGNVLGIFTDLNQIAHERVNDAQQPNPVKIVDALWMVEQAFGSYKAFEKEVEKRRLQIDDSTLELWERWYATAVGSVHFPSEDIRRAFTLEKARWRAAVRTLHYNGGKYGKGFVGFSPDALPFSPTGRNTNMLALQLVPRNSYLPHQRSIVYDPACGKWDMMAYADIKTTNVSYTPRFSRNYTYPFYYEKKT